MTGEIDLFGVFVSPLLLFVIVTIPLHSFARAGMHRFNLYRFFWHRSLFDLALFSLILGGVFALGQSLS